MNILLTTVAMLVLVQAKPTPPPSKPGVEKARYVMTLQGMPVGVVSFWFDGTTYEYHSTQVFRSTTRDVTQRFELTSSNMKPEVWWLSKKRPDGCVRAIEERTRQAELLCTYEGGGTISGRGFHADYDADGSLRSLAVENVSFEASDAPLPVRADPFAEGFAISGTKGPLRIEPSVKGSAPAEVVGSKTGPERPPEVSCIQIAREVVAKTAGASVVLGVVAENGRAWPHAWVKTRKGQHLDPTIAAGDEKGREYLEFSSDVGSVYLELLAGKRRAVR